MGLDLLDTPVRLTWDIPSGADRHRSANLSAVAGRIAEGGVFFVTLQGQPLRHAELPEIAAALRGCQLLAVCRGHDDELPQLARLPSPGIQLQLDAAPFVTAAGGVDHDGLDDVLGKLRQAGHEPLLSLTPLRHNLCNIPDLLRFCRDRQVARFKLPNAHIGDSFNDYSTADLPRWPDLESFRERWREFRKDSAPLPAMDIHDLFLWEIMTPDRQQNRSEYGGCQAGNSLGHVDAHGIVHPCAAWPHPLGRLPGQSLEEVWAGAERLAVRQGIAVTPEGCLGCRDLGICFGGCRGLARHLNRCAGERDLMCRGPR